ncbi:interferon-induced transmembrane protein 2-like [Hippocampus comes]|uniref:interferon-induced transmembrane protein 2-like n=1 Tax=Hippocampus comes TaxID=109280 RepID=UPI00094F3466|nr:PREDICTED: interferon-induced transmembrane protein 2-like [Hippocampus comes]
MNPAASPNDAVPMKATTSDEDAGQASGPTVVEVNTVDENTPRPPDYIILSLFSFVYFGNPFCLGLAALICSIKARDRKVVGDLEAAQKHAYMAKRLNFLALSFFGLFVFLLVVVYAFLVASAKRRHV